MIKLLIGGSPCTYWSIAQKNNRETMPEGLGWELFENYLIAKAQYCPDYFLYENNESMDKKIKEQITKELRAEPIMINSALVSAQNRKRLYWTDIPNVRHPEDKGILLQDIIEDGITDKEKANCLTTRKSDIYCYLKGSRQAVFNAIRLGTIGGGGQSNRVYSLAGKSVTITAKKGGGGSGTGLYAFPLDEAGRAGRTVYKIINKTIEHNGKKYNINLPNGYYGIRALTVKECRRLQTVPDSYIMPCSSTQNYRMLGNGWTVDVITHILSGIPKIKEERIEVLSMYDGMSCGRIALEKLGAKICAYYASEVDKYAVRTTLINYPDTIYLGDAFGIRKTMQGKDENIDER